MIAQDSWVETVACVIVEASSRLSQKCRISAKLTDYYYYYYYRKKRFRWRNVKRLQGHLTNAKAGR